MTETWKDAAKYLSSLLILDREDDRPASGFHGAFIPAVAESFILRLTSVSDWIWDPFAGSGTTGIVAKRLGRECFMTDLNVVTAPDWNHGIIPADARSVKVVRVKEQGYPMIKDWMGNQPDDGTFLFDLVILHPPYHNIISFGSPQVVGDLSRCPDLPAFYNLWTAACLNIVQHIKPGGYVGLVCGDIWVTGKACVEPLAHNCMRILLAALGPGARLKAIQIKNIVGNQAFEKQGNFKLSRFYKWGAVRFSHEMLYTIQRGK